MSLTIQIIPSRGKVLDSQLTATVFTLAAGRVIGGAVDVELLIHRVHRLLASSALDALTSKQRHIL